MKSNQIVKIILISRPQFLLVGILQFFLGTGIARYLGHDIRQDIFLLGFFWILTVQLTGNYLDAAFDDSQEILSTQGKWYDLQHSPTEGEKLPRGLVFLVFGTLLTGTALLTFGLINVGVLNFAGILFMVLMFLTAVFYSVPSINLSVSGYGELALSIVVGTLIPAFAFVLHAGELHRLLAMSTFPLTTLIISGLLVDELSRFTQNQRLGRRNLLMRIGWERGMVLHNIFILMSFVILGLATVFRLPTTIALPAFLPLPLGLLQIWYMWRISLGAKPNWTALTISSFILFSTMSYLITFAYWTRS
jgi:1,4-dihydroxy-2-naphthoate octaprenyltransferase